MADNAQSPGADESLHYLRKSRSLSHSIVCILPLLVLYQVGIVQGGYPQHSLIEQWITGWLLGLGLPASHVLNAALLIGLIAALWRTEHNGRFSIHVALIVPFEGALLALALYKGGTALTRILMDHAVVFGAGLDAYAPYLLGLGASVYEELLFRLLLLGGGGLALHKLFRWDMVPSYGLALVLSSLLFSYVHHIGGEPFETGVFVFRAICGILLGGVFLARGLGVAVWTHALYNVMALYQASITAA